MSSDFIFGAISAAAIIVGFAYFVLRSIFVSRDVFDSCVKSIEKRITDREFATQQEHTKLATKAELDKLEGTFAALVDKVNESNRELDAKITTLQNGLWWLIAKAGGKEETIQKLFKIE